MNYRMIFPALALLAVIGCNKGDSSDPVTAQGPDDPPVTIDFEFIEKSSAYTIHAYGGWTVDPPESVQVGELYFTFTFQGYPVWQDKLYCKAGMNHYIYNVQFKKGGTPYFDKAVVGIKVTMPDGKEYYNSITYYD